MTDQSRAVEAPATSAAPDPVRRHDVLVIGGGAGGIACAASLLKRQPDLDIGLVEPSDVHAYQPGWTLVGAGVFKQAQTLRPMAGVMPGGVHWIRGAVDSFAPAVNQVVLESGERIGYQWLVLCPGLKLDWDKVDGLRAALGNDGVTSNYEPTLAPYTWELVQALKGGKAIFTQPPMPIKCAGAPQKALYLSADHWYRSARLSAINVEFCNAGATLFGVAAYVPALMEYVRKYQATLSFGHDLLAVNGPARTAVFQTAQGPVEKPYDMMHVCPPQSGLDFMRNSPMVDAAGWVDVDRSSLRHRQFANVFGMGDACSTPNAKTAAAVRKQAPVVAQNLLALRAGRPMCAIYDGYGSCPLTVERGKIVLAEFLYDGIVKPTFPDWLIKGTEPSRLAWFLKEKLLPPMYWNGMFHGREWLAEPELVAAPTGTATDGSA